MLCGCVPLSIWPTRSQQLFARAAIKKAAKAYEKLRSAEDQAVKLLDSDDLAALEACPDTVALEVGVRNAHCITRAEAQLSSAQRYELSHR